MATSTAKSSGEPILRAQFHSGVSPQLARPTQKTVRGQIGYALAVVDDPTPAYPELRQLTEPKIVAGRSYAGFNPARREDVRLFKAILDGDHIARGSRNADIRVPLFSILKKDDEKRRASAAVGRLIKRLHVRQLVAKVPRTRRWRVTKPGRQLLGMAMQLYCCFWPQLAA